MQLRIFRYHAELQASPSLNDTNERIQVPSITGEQDTWITPQVSGFSVKKRHDYSLQQVISYPANFISFHRNKV